MKNVLLASAAVVAIFVLPAVAGAAVTTYSGQDDGAAVGGSFANSDAAAATLAAASGPLTTIDFESLATGFQSSYVLPDVTITLSASDYGDGFSGISSTTYGNLYGFDVGTGGGNWLGFPGGGATFTFGSAKNAFGFYTTGLQTTFGATFNVSFVDGSAQSFDVPSNTNGGVSYFGFTDTASFTSVTISQNGAGDAWGIDNVSFDAAPSVPEPATWAMMIVGFGLTGAALRRRPAKTAFAA